MPPSKKKHTPVAPATLTAVLKWILEANDERDIREAIRKEFPEANEAAVLQAAVAEIEAIGNESPDFTRGWALAASRELVRKMIEIGDYNNALRGIKQVNELAGGK